MKKRGAMPVEIVIVLVILIVTAIIVIAFTQGFFRKTTEQTTQLTPSKISTTLTACKLQSARGFSDSDGDGYPDFCDICKGGNDAKHSDNDWVPDACDANPEKFGKIEVECPANRMIQQDPFKCQCIAGRTDCKT